MKCALVGNQNSGKSLLFNDLTGMNQKVGNRAGVTIERKDGIIKNTDIEITDIPGIYSLSPYTSEEEVSRQYIIEENPDLIINIIDSTSIERSLYLTTQLLELGRDVIIVLNMEDILKKRGYKIDIKQLENLLSISAFSISALKKTGIKELVNAIVKKDYKKNPLKKIYSEDIEKYIENVSSFLPNSMIEKRFVAIKILERDERYNKLKEEIKENINLDSLIENIESNHNDDSEELIATERYQFIENVRNKVVTKTGKRSITDKIDKVLLNKWAAIPIFILIMIIMFTLSVGIVGGLTVNLIDTFFNGCDGSIPFEMFGFEIASIKSNWIGIGPYFGNLIEQANGSPWAVSIVRDGIVAGVGAVCNFVPQLIILFLLLSLLETSGYMARVTFLFDNFFRKIGLSGKSLIPFIVGMGCSVPAVMASRTVEDKNEHKMTVTLTPFIPCNAKLPIIATICGGFFGPFSLLITILMYFMAIGIIIFVGWFLNKFFIKTKSTTYLIELPEYHIPSARYVFRDTFDKTLSFIKRAGTIILLSSIIVWFLSSFTYDFHFVDGEIYLIDQSFLSYIGRGLSWIFYPMVGIGHNYNDIWGVSVSTIQGLVAKEQVISSMQVIAKVADEGDIFSSSMFSFINPVTAFALMTFNLFSAPCFGTIGAMKRELGSTKEMFKAIGIEIGFAWVIATIIGIVGGILGVVGVF